MPREGLWFDKDGKKLNKGHDWDGKNIKQAYDAPHLPLLLSYVIQFHVSFIQIVQFLKLGNIKI